MPVTNINPPTLSQMLAENPDLQLIDVRTTPEYLELGHIQQAQSIPLHTLPMAFQALDKNQDLAVTCQHGVRSLDACAFLHAQGFTRLFNLEEGMASWPGPVVLSSV